ncbi:hypothetical protein EUTSA_v10009029mg [Eutrema salsugineum]|uniref:Pollen Ole e 1 allergen and extensin family protein n=1 Tax=Eutrema salsugineum TaxID=72664 RepID=V4L388_EUTSA|nr:uncharacterized protein LOC18992394 [Eutrema salsugineum]ESQ34208.1 hypothetical protein EUTSA_v10009029mg [Eutrema salsugineum]
MAKANVFLLSIFVIASLSSLSHGLTINGIRIGTLEIDGVLRCTLNANTNAPPISGQTVSLRCAGSNTNLAQAVTNPAGAFRVVLNIVDTLAFDPSFCAIQVNLPVATCSVFPPDGVLTASFRLVNVVQGSVGNIANFVTGSFITSL